MLPFAYYLIKVIICSGILFGYYWLMLRNKIYHRYNRFYLLTTAVLSLVIPLIQINIWHRVDTPAQSIKLLQVVTGSNEYLDEIVLTARRNNFTGEQVILLLYTVTSIIFCFLFIQVLLKIRTLLKQHQQTTVDNICFVNTTAKGTPFSFLRYIFWNDNIDISTTTGNQIFKHELAHVQQKHSHDKLFINALLIFFWCNPFFWLIRKELDMIHEFMADKIAVEDSDTEAFAAMILHATYPQHRFALTNPFFYSPIKRRLLMLIKNKNPKAGYIGRILVLPLAVLLFAAFTLKTKAIKNYVGPLYSGKKITVVIDAGHGGKDFGAVSTDGSFTEKELVLSISQKIKSFNNNKNIQIILTRERDIYQSPQEKVAFSKSQNPDLFVSIHVDGALLDSAAEKTGMSVWVAKNNYANVTNSKLFASAIINEFANNYKIQVTELPQQRQSGIWVVQESSCPAVLIEAGYITNQKDLNYMQTEDAKESIARNILAAIEKYASADHLTSDAQMLLDTVPVSKVTPAVSSKPSATVVPAIKQVPPASVQGEVKAISSIKPVPAIQGEVKAIPSVKPVPAVSPKPSPKAVPAKPISPTATADNAKQTSNNKVYNQVKNDPKFPGGDTAWRRYLETNLDPGIPVDNGAPEGTYPVVVKFIVNKDGSIGDVRAETKYGYGMEEAAVNLIKKGHKWEPAIKNGNIITAYKKQRITFLIQEQ